MSNGDTVRNVRAYERTCVYVFLRVFAYVCALVYGDMRLECE